MIKQEKNILARIYQMIILKTFKFSTFILLSIAQGILNSNELHHKKKQNNYQYLISFWPNVLENMNIHIHSDLQQLWCSFSFISKTLIRFCHNVHIHSRIINYFAISKQLLGQTLTNRCVPFNLTIKICPSETSKLFYFHRTSRKVLSRK